MTKIIAAFTWIALLAACSTFSIANRKPSSTGVHFCTEFQNIYFISVSDSISADCASFNYFDRAITDMNSLRISTSKPFLGSIVLNEFSSWNWGTENWFAGTIEAYIKPNDPSWAKANEYIFAHEVGHLFLQAFLAEKDPMLAELTETQKRSFEYYKYLMPILELKKSDDTCKDADSTCGKKIQAMAQQSPVNLNGISGDKMIADFTTRNRQKVDKFLDVISPYHELFADLLESLYFDDPNANDVALSGVHMPTEKCRTFSGPLPSDFMSADPHCSLSAIRADLWQGVVRPLLPDKRKILLKVAISIWEEAESQIQNGKIESSVAAKNLLSRLTGKND